MLFWSLLVAGLSWSTLALLALIRSRKVPDLSSLPQHPDAEAQSLLVVMPARDEEARVAEAVRRLRDQDGLDLRMALVDDRSEDETAAIYDAAAAADSKVTVVHVDELPEGWLGKNHACHAGVSAAEEAAKAAGIAAPTWTLFMDADGWLEPGTLRRAVDDATAERAQHLCLAPKLADTTWSGQAALVAFDMPFYLQSARVNADHKGAYAGIGAFNLIRTDVYREIGGHQALRMEVVDDIEMGRRVRTRGYRSRVRVGRDLLESRWITTLGSYFQLTEKNFFAALNFSILRVATLVLVMGTLWALAAFGPWITASGTGPNQVAGCLALTGLLTLVLPGVANARRQGYPSWVGLATPASPLLPILGVLWSTLQTYRHGVRWRGRHYTIAEARRARSKGSDAD